MGCPQAEATKMGSIYPPISTTERLVFIDGLRGLAAAGVTLFHFAGHRIFDPPPSGVAGFLLGLARHGNEGVPVFFVISGFVIAQSIATNRISLKYAEFSCATFD